MKRRGGSCATSSFFAFAKETSKSKSIHILSPIELQF